MSSRLRFLLGLLLAVILVFLPAYYMEQSIATLKQESQQSEQELTLLRDKKAAAESAEAKLDTYSHEAEGLSVRLLSRDPFSDMYRELVGAATKSGLKVVDLKLYGAEEVEGLPDLVRYRANVTLGGSVEGYLRFLEALEKHRLLIEIPDLDFELPAARVAVSAVGSTATSTATPAASAAAGPTASSAVTSATGSAASSASTAAGKSTSAAAPATATAGKSAAASAQPVAVAWSTKLEVSFFGKAADAPMAQPAGKGSAKSEAP